MEMLKKYANSFVSIGLVILTVIVLLNSYSILKLSKDLDSVLQKEKESLKPVAISIVSLECSGKDCVSLNKELAALKSGNVKVNDESTASGRDASQLISKYGIKRLPALVVTGEVESLNLAGYIESGDALVLESKSTPYQDAVTGKVNGLVRATLIEEKSCTDCADLNILLQGLEESGVVLSEKKELSTNDATELFSKYNITKLPALILSEDFSAYELSSAWDRLGHVAEDGSYVLDLPSPPYYDIKTKTVHGLVKFTGITDSSCTECYNVTQIHVSILQRMGLFLKDRKVVDSSSAEGKQLIEKYGIKSLPTMILSKEASDYAGFVRAWNDVGTIESDGSFVFRDNSVLELTYKDLVSGKVIKPEP